MSAVFLILTVDRHIGKDRLPILFLHLCTAGLSPIFSNLARVKIFFRDSRSRLLLMIWYFIHIMTPLLKWKVAFYNLDKLVFWVVCWTYGITHFFTFGSSSFLSSIVLNSSCYLGDRSFNVQNRACIRKISLGFYRAWSCFFSFCNFFTEW